jgi:hypothetical protein
MVFLEGTKIYQGNFKVGAFRVILAAGSANMAPFLTLILKPSGPQPPKNFILKRPKNFSEAAFSAKTGKVKKL